MKYPFRGHGAGNQAETNCSRRQNTSYLHYKQKNKQERKKVYIVS